MRIVALCCLVFCAGALAAQQSVSPFVRSIQVRWIATSETSDEIDFEAITAAWKSKGIGLEVEKRYDAAAVEKAAEVIRDLYRQQGRKVRVEHKATQIPPRSLQVTFEVVELCTCN